MKCFLHQRLVAIICRLTKVQLSSKGVQGGEGGGQDRREICSGLNSSNSAHDLNTTDYVLHTGPRFLTSLSRYQSVGGNLSPGLNLTPLVSQLLRVYQHEPFRLMLVSNGDPVRLKQCLDGKCLYASYLGAASWPLARYSIHWRHLPQIVTIQRVLQGCLV